MNALEGMSWDVCLGGNVLGCTPWRECLGMFALEGMSWDECLGGNVLG